MSEFIKVAEVHQVAPGRGMLVKAKGREIALFNVDGNFYAINNSCPHSTGPLAEGRLFGTIITCPWHGSQFDVTTGQHCGGPAVTAVTTYPVRVEGGAVYIEIT